MKFRYCLSAFVAVLGATTILAAPGLTLTPNKPDAIYQPGEKIIWRADVRGDAGATIKQATYVLKRGGGTVIDQGAVNFTAGSASIQTSLKEPGTILAEITATDAGGKVIHALAGAAIAPEKISVSSPCPDDFDTFWKAKLGELATVPENPVLTPQPGGKPGVSYYKITLDNIRGTHIQGQLARPASGGKFPAMLIVQWAGVYPLQKGSVTDRAAEGWLALNINAHDLPIDEPAAFYDKLLKGSLKDYTAIGNDDREKSYFLRMFLSCYRAAEYLSQRPDWDGRTLVVTGTSQGGLQSFVTAGLNPKVTGLMALVPAGCDPTGDLVGRKPGWPYWMTKAAENNLDKVRATSRYFDAVNFAARIKCPALVGLGLIDTTSPPSGVYAAFNQLKGPKEVIVMPPANHHGDNHTHTAYLNRAADWRAALLKGKLVPPSPN